MIFYPGMTWYQATMKSAEPIQSSTQAGNDQIEKVH